jgi:4-hydroxy-tetrahydrodipicolinate synthase
MKWQGVIPAITTKFLDDGTVDHEFLATHAEWMIDAGCTGIVALGSLGEGATLTYGEKVECLQTLCNSLDGKAPVVAGISALSTQEAVDLALDAEEAGCSGLMVLPPYVYKGTWDENRAHFEEIINATDLSCMLYNNPIAYGVDILPEQVQELCELDNLHAIKESSADVRRITSIRALIDDRLTLAVGVDDVFLEGAAAGATCWIAGVVNAFPAESVKLYDLAMAGKYEEARPLYEWMLPLLRLDTTFDFVQLIKMIQQEVGMGSEAVRAPRKELTGAYRAEIIEIIQQAIATKPEL